MIEFLSYLAFLLLYDPITNDGCDRDGCSPVPKPPKVK